MNIVQSVKNNKKGLLYIAFTIVLIILLIRYGHAAVGILKPFVISAVFAYLLNPIVEIFEKRKIKRIFGVIIVYLMFFSLIILFGLILIPRLIRDIGFLVENVPQYSEQVQIIIKSFQDGYIYRNLPQSIRDIINDNIYVIQNELLNILQNVANSIIGWFSRLFSLIIIPVITFYLLKDSNYFKNQLILAMPKSKRGRVILLARDIDNVFGRFIRGQIIIAAFVGIMTTIALLIINVKYAVFLGIFVGFAEIIPYFGPFLGFIPTILFALFDSPTKAFYAGAAFILIQQIESGILTPKIIGESVGIHPVYVIMSLIIGGKFMGIAGLIIAVPVLAAIKLTFRHFLRSERSG